MSEDAQGKDQSLQPFQPPQTELLKKEGNPFRQTLELMQKNGTDKDTLKAYIACVYATELMLGIPGSENRLSYPGVGEIPVNLFSPDTYLWVKGMGRIRFIKGGPREYFDHGETRLRTQDVTSGVTIELSQYTDPYNRYDSREDYHPTWEDYVKDEPYYYDLKKEDGTLNSCRNVIIYPGTEDKPGNMYGSIFRTGNELIIEEFEKPNLILPPVLKKRAIDAWRTLAEFEKRVPLAERDKGRGKSESVKAFFDGWTGRNTRADSTLKSSETPISVLLSTIRLGIAKPRTEGLKGLAFEIRKIVEDQASFWGSLPGELLDEVRYWKDRHPS